MDTQYRKNLKAVATACKNYTDKTKEEILWHIGDYSISTQDDNTTASTKTVPTGATRLKIKRVYGLTEKFNPSVAYDDASTMTKTMPNIVYDFDCSIVYGDSKVSENLIVLNDVAETTTNGITYKVDNGVITLNGTATGWVSITLFSGSLSGTYTFKDFGSGTSTASNNIRIAESGSYTKFIPISNISTATDITAIQFYCEANTILTNVVIKPMLVKGTTAPTEWKQGFEGIHNFAWNGITIKDSNDTTQESISIDLSTILYNGSPLFDNGLLGYNGVADSITPYKATKKRSQITITNDTVLNKQMEDSGNGIGVRIYVPDIVKNTYGNSTILSNLTEYSQITYNTYYSSDGVGYAVHNTSTNANIVYVRLGAGYDTVEKVKNYLISKNAIFNYELIEPIEVSIDWSSTLRGIQGYSNGTITLQNTYNMDTANTITYNSIIKENCCAKIVQSRGGSVVKTINLPTVASDGYSAGSVNNVRDLTTSKRYTNVSKNSSLGSLNWVWHPNSSKFYSASLVNDIKTTTIPVSNIYDCSLTSSTNNYTLELASNGYLWVKTDGTNSIKPSGNLYYELADASKTESDITAIDNIIEVEPNDTIAFLDENDNAVNVPSDLTYRIEVERV